MHRDDIVITPEYVLGRYFIRYDKLNELFHYAYNGMEVNRVNLFIDLYSVYHAVFSRSYRTTVKEYVALTSQIINLCIHYRTYFRHLGIYCKIFIISSYNIPQDSLQLIPEYNSIMVDKLKNKIIEEMVDLNTGLLEILCPYLPDIHFIKTDYESSVVMNHIINIENSIPSEDKAPIQSIILTSDLYPIQLAAQLPNVSYLHPIKTFKKDDSFIVPQNTLSDAKFQFWRAILRKFQNSFSYDRVGSISPSNFVLLAALNRFPDRCLNLLYNVSVSSKLISQVIGFDSIKITPQSLFDMVPREQFGEIDLDYIDRRYKVLDFTYQSILYNQSIESKTLHYENLEDSNAINLINDKYFKNNPIDIFRL